MSKAYRDAGFKDGDLKAQARFTEIKDFGKSMTSQAPSEEVDINKIVTRMLKTGFIPVANDQPFYGDVSDLGGLAESYIKIQEAEELFMQYPADVRERFENDPVKFVSFLGDEKNYDEALRLKLVNPRPTPPVPEPAAPPSK